MGEIINQIVTWLNEVTGQNAIVAGAVSLWGLGVITYLARNVPSKIWAFIVRQMTVTLVINNHSELFYQFMSWYYDTKRSQKSRTLIAEYNEGNRSKVSAGYGIHFFIFEGRIFKLTRLEKEATGVWRTKETISLTSIGRSQRAFHKLMLAINPPEEFSETKIHKWAGHGWSFLNQQPRRPLKTVIIPKDTRENLIHSLEEFRNEKRWYLDNGIPYRIGIMLHGPPGTGKTSLVMALCGALETDLYILDPESLSSNGDATSALASLGTNAIVLMEDIDAFQVTRKRNYNEQNVGSPPPIDAASLVSSLSDVSLSSLLNAIDGVSSSNGRILIATTNHYDSLDPALVRKGRFDLTIELTYVDTEGFHEFFKRFYPNFELSDNVEFPSNVAPADLQSLVFEHRNDPEGALKALQARVDK